MLVCLVFKMPAPVSCPEVALHQMTCICLGISWARFRGAGIELMSLMTVLWHRVQQSKKMICVLSHFSLAACSVIETAPAYAFTKPNLCLWGDDIFLFWRVTSFPEIVAFGPVFWTDRGWAVCSQSGSVCVTFVPSPLLLNGSSSDLNAVRGPSLSEIELHEAF